MSKPSLTQEQIMALYQHHESGEPSAFYDPRGTALGYLSAYVIEDCGAPGQLMIVTEISNAGKYGGERDAWPRGGSLCYRRIRSDKDDGWNDWVLTPGPC